MCFQYVEDMSILGDMSPRRIVKKDGFLVAHESNICPKTLKIMIAIYYNHITTIKGKDSNHIWFDGYHIILDPLSKMLSTANYLRSMKCTGDCVHVSVSIFEVLSNKKKLSSSLLLSWCIKGKALSKMLP